MIPFSPPRIDEQTIKAVAETLRSGWITTGPKTKQFELELTQYTGAKKTFCCNANTNGMELFLRWLGVGPGDEVIVPAYTYCATANVVIHLGATPVLVDVDSHFLIDPIQVNKAVNVRTKAIIPVDLGGLPADYDRLWEMIHAHKPIFKANSETQQKLGRIALMADSAHSIGARQNGRMLGSQADAMIFSFHAVKNLTTAEGGAVCLNLPAPFDHNQVYQWLNSMSLHGQTKDALAKTQAGSWEYDIADAGWKCNMTDLQATIGLVELGRYESETLPKRKALASAYSALLKAYAWAEVPAFEVDKGESSYHLYMLRVKGATKPQRDAIIQEISKNEVSVNVHYKPLPLLTAYKNRGYSMDDYPEAQRLWENEISLPIYFDLTIEQVHTVVEAVADAVNKVMA